MSALYYPCCGSTDIVHVLDGFAHEIEVFHGSELTCPRLAFMRQDWSIVRLSRTQVEFEPELKPDGPDGIRWMDGTSVPTGSGSKVEYAIRRSDGSVGLRRLIWHGYDAVEALRRIDRISVFFARRDGGRQGEGSSGIRWFGDILLARILAKLEQGGRIVTDGAGMHGERPQARLWTAPRSASKIGERFRAFDREFTLERIFCAERTPTLVWRVD
jgi:hypothetical protein